MGKRLSVLTSNINILNSHGGDPEIKGLAYDSGNVKKGFLFFALTGLHTDGHLYIGNAVENGAAAVIYSSPLSGFKKGVAYIQTKNPRFDMAAVSSEFYGNPSKKLKIIGVTGTDGKSTTVYLIYQLLKAHGINAGFLSTVQSLTGNKLQKNPYRQSTPEATEIQSFLKESADAGSEFTVLEATSHGLSERNNRLGNISFHAAVFTNAGQEHLEFHGNFEQYISDKANLFRKLYNNNNALSFGVVNLDDNCAGFFQKAAKRPVYTYSTKNPAADLYASNLISYKTGTEFVLTYKNKSCKANINLPGIFNVENTLAAALTVLKLQDTNIKELIPFLPELRAVEGRMKTIDMGQPFTVIVDYAHTPGSFKKIFPMVRSQTTKKVISLFGSAGERDIKKRQLQGSIACLYSDTIILSDEDPRREDPLSILKEIAAGCKNKKENSSLFLIPDRNSGIKKAFSLAGKGDTVLLLGKGHESSIIYEHGQIPWNEEEAAVECLKELGFNKYR